MPHWGIGQWASAMGILVSITLLLAFAFDRIGRPIRKMTDQWDEFKEDWYGKSARTGFKSVPGIPERLERIEEAQNGSTDRLANIETQLRTNGGGTLRDEIIKIRDRLDEHLRFHAWASTQVPPQPPAERDQPNV